MLHNSKRINGVFSKQLQNLRIVKQLLYLIMASFLGAAIALSLDGYGTAEKINDLEASVRMVNSSPSAVGSSFDFVKASQIARSAVVQIDAMESEALAQQRYQKEKRNRRSPFDDFFGGSWSDMFGQNFYQPKGGRGSGVIISEDGFIISNNHVVGFADNIKVTISRNGEVKTYKARKIGTDPSTDLAVIKIEADNLPYLNYGDSEGLKIGEWVLAIGNPFNLASTVTAGIVSAKGRDLDIIKGEKTIEEFIQTDAAVNPGNSGGALVNVEGELVGINTAISTPTGVFAGYSFAIPSDLVKKVVKTIIEKGGDIDRNINLGIAGWDVDQDLVKEFDLKREYGFYVDEVERGSAAQLSGLLPGDVVVNINGNKVEGFDVIKNNMKLNMVGDVIELVIDRQGKKKDIIVKLKKGL